LLPANSGRQRAFDLDSAVWVDWLRQRSEHGHSSAGRVPLDFRPLPMAPAETSRLDPKASAILLAARYCIATCHIGNPTR
jgi:hypothetical protein